MGSPSLSFSRQNQSLTASQTIFDFDDVVRLNCSFLMSPIEFSPRASIFFAPAAGEN